MKNAVIEVLKTLGALDGVSDKRIHELRVFGECVVFCEWNKIGLTIDFTNGKIYNLDEFTIAIRGIDGVSPSENVYNSFNLFPELEKFKRIEVV